MHAVLLLSLLAAPGEVTVHRDLPYAQPANERQTLDIYCAAGGAQRPIVFWIHGGGWQRGDKREVDAKPQAFVDRGCVFVSTNYRFVPQVTIQEMARDIARAIRFVHERAADYGGDPNTFFVMGHSAGAQLAALVCTDGGYLKAEGLPLSIVKGCVPVDGDTYDVPLQIATVEQRRKEIYAWKFGDENSQRELSPVSHAAKDRSIPPFLVLHVADHPETTAQSQRLVKALEEAGIRADAFAAQGKDHTTINSGLGATDDEPTAALFAFLGAALAGKASSDPSPR